MAFSYWNIEDGNGHTLAEGMQPEAVARKAAQSLANERNESVWIYGAGSSHEGTGDVDTEIEAEEIKPE